MKHMDDTDQPRHVVESTEARGSALAVPVWSKSGPSAASMLGIGRSLAYAAAASGDIPTCKVGGRVLVPVEALRRSLLTKVGYES